MYSVMKKRTLKIRISKRMTLLLLLEGLFTLVLIGLFAGLCRNAPGPGPMTVLHISGVLFSMLISMVIALGLARAAGRPDGEYRHFLRINSCFTFLLGLDVLIWLKFGAKAEGTKFWMTQWYVLPMALQVFAYIWSFYRMSRRSRQLQESMRQLMSRDVAEGLSTDESDLFMEGEKKITILFCQIHRFEDCIRGADPKAVIRVLRFFFSEVSGIMEKYNGTVLSFPGHSVLCIFGAPVTVPDDEKRAVDAALEIREEMRNFAEICAQTGLPAITAGIGINTGIANIGSVGDENQKRFTVIGTAVNLASRIESYTADGEILIAESTRSMLDEHYRTESAGTVRPKGIEKAVFVYRVTGTDGEKTVSAGNKKIG